MIQVTPVILCGGSGTRLWPLSRTGFPKQFLCLTGNESLFQQAAERLAALGTDHIQVAAPVIVSGEDHRFLASEQLREVGIALGTALLEPTGRNTAPALTLAALAAVQNGQDPVLVVTPADQTIANPIAFTAAVQQAIAQAEQGNIVILGVTPDKPETGFGYIKVAGHCEERSDAAIHPLNVQAFVEKPNLQTAQQYLSEGGYYWNAGMFVLKASVWLAAIEQFAPAILQATRTAWAARKTDGAFVRPGKAEFEAIPSESVDYAVMEHCPGSAFPIQMVPLDAGWNDLGAWDAVWQVQPKDAQGNAHVGDVLHTESHNTLVHASSRLVALVGVSDLVVVETADAVLVASKSHSQDVKHIVNQLTAQNREEQTLHRKVHRPWGWYDSIDEGGRFKVKRIQVKPKASLSLQKHHHRAEHWIVVTGTAEITNGDKVLSYIRPHRHSSDPREELLIAVRGVMALVTFNDHGDVTNVLRFGTERHGDEMALGAEVSSSTWHTVIALEPGCVLLEVKAGPFDPNQPKDLAPWAPEEGSFSASTYLDRIVKLNCKASSLK